MKTVNLQIIDIDPAFIISSYSGKTGCMCGCKGKYSYSSKNVEIAEKQRGYGISLYEISDIAIKRMISKMKKENPTAFTNNDGSICDNLYIETYSRINSISLIPGSMKTLIESGKIIVK